MSTQTTIRAINSTRIATAQRACPPSGSALTDPSFEARQRSGKGRPAMNSELPLSSSEIAPAGANARRGHGIRLTMVGTLFMLVILSMSWTTTPTHADAATGLPRHGWSGMEYCMSMDTFWLSSIYAFRSDPAKPETVYWRGTLQKWNGTAWSNVAGTSVPWQGFSAAYKSADGSVQWGALIGGASPTWKITVAGYYRVVNRFYWSRTGRYSAWEPTHFCYFNPPNWG